MKKVLSFILALIFCVPALGFSVFAEGEEIEVNAKSAILMDVASGEVLYAVNENEQLYPASVTKIMPMLLFMEALDNGKMTLEEIVTASPTAASKGGSQIWLKEGEQMTVDELLRATAIASANDACTALGEHLAGSEEAFVKMMNERAAALGMTNTHFDNCSGLDDDTETHLTTAYDIALMSCELLKHERIKTYTTVWMDTLRNGATELVNTNRLVRFYNGTTGLKTGTTSKAGHCLSASAERDGLHLVAVVMGAQNSTDRFEGAKALLNWGFANYESFTPQIDSSQIADVTVIRGTEGTVRPIVSGVGAITIEAGKKSLLETEIELAADVEAPVEENQVLGCVRLKIGSEIIGEYPLMAEKSVRRITFGDIVARFFKAMTKSEQQS
ncbi:MAG: D-alanyl-D-alanine carboxypeptidase [Clostridia bacterium]|nr:D-alanyl-D-alanine carboxypeptidase [Clostridia bacterium]